jgi:hypothetical protein
MSDSAIYRERPIFIYMQKTYDLKTRARYNGALTSRGGSDARIKQFGSSQPERTVGL